MGNTGVIILAGGKSERMHYPKPFLLFDSNKTFLEKIVKEYVDFGCNEIIIVLNDELLAERWKKYLEKLPGNVVMIPNHHMDYGRFFSVKLGLSGLKNSDYCFMQDADHPLVSRQLLDRILKNKSATGCTIPSYKDKNGHPILLSALVINHILKIKQDGLNLKNVLSNFERNKIIADSDEILLNINTPGDYKKYFGFFHYSSVT